MARFKGTNRANFLKGGVADDVLLGRFGNDTILGGAGNDRSFGEAGNDLLIDGIGKDRFKGGTGADIFRFGRDGVTDRIVDFDAGEDVIDLSPLGVAGFDDLRIKQVANGVVVVAGGERLFLKGVEKAALEEGDFRFADRDPITFESLNAAGGDDPDVADIEDVDDNHRGVDWDNFFFRETDEYRGVFPENGYRPTSGTTVAFNDNGGLAEIQTADGLPFDLEQVFASAAWRDGLTLVVTGYLNDVLMGSQTFALDVKDPILLRFDDAHFDHVDEVEFVAFGGEEVFGIGNPQVSFDDFVIF